jgi:hypothetical protein
MDCIQQGLSPRHGARPMGESVCRGGGGAGGAVSNPPARLDAVRRSLHSVHD